MSSSSGGGSWGPPPPPGDPGSPPSPQDAPPPYSQVQMLDLLNAIKQLEKKYLSRLLTKILEMDPNNPQSFRLAIEDLIKSYKLRATFIGEIFDSIDFAENLHLPGYETSLGIAIVLQHFASRLPPDIAQKEKHLLDSFKYIKKLPSIVAKTPSNISYDERQHVMGIGPAFFNDHKLDESKSSLSSSQPQLMSTEETRYLLERVLRDYGNQAEPIIGFIKNKMQNANEYQLWQLMLVGLNNENLRHYAVAAFKYKYTGLPALVDGILDRPSKKIDSILNEISETFFLSEELERAVKGSLSKREDRGITEIVLAGLINTFGLDVCKTKFIKGAQKGESTLQTIQSIVRSKCMSLQSNNNSEEVDKDQQILQAEMQSIQPAKKKNP